MASTLFNSSQALPTLAVVEDDEELCEKILVPALRNAGFDLSCFSNALGLYRALAGTKFDLVMLDVVLPDDDGIGIARHLRELSPNLGIVVYSAYGRTEDRMRGLQAGVDAYLVKPLGMDEVSQTLHSIHRRTKSAEVPAEGKDWSFVRQGWFLLAPSGVEISLSQSERQVLKTLVANRGELVTRETLIGSLTGNVDEFDPRRLEMLVYRLRKKCFDAAGENLPLRAARGAGYIFGV